MSQTASISTKTDYTTEKQSFFSQLIAKISTNSKLGVAAFVLVLLIIFLIGAVAAYWRNYSSTIVTSTTITSGDENGIFKNLEVKRDTVLGKTNTDTISTNARFDTDVVPYVDTAKNLGRTDKKWKNVYLENLSFSTGISASLDNDGYEGGENLKLTGGLGFRKVIGDHIKDASHTVQSDKSGFIFVVETTTTTSITLPKPTGSGAEFTFITDDITSSLEITSGGGSDKFYGQAVVGAKGGSGVSSSVFSSDSINHTKVTIDSSLPVDDGGTSSGILAGSKFIFTDVSSGYWMANLNLIAHEGVSGKSFRNPFSI